MRDAVKTQRAEVREPTVPVIEVYRDMGRAYLAEYGLGPAFAEGLQRCFEGAAVEAYCAPFRAQLTKLNLENSRIARAIGVDPSTVSKWLSSGTISFWNFVKVLAAFGIDILKLPFPRPGQAVVQAYATCLRHVTTSALNQEISSGPAEDDVRCLIAWSNNGTWLQAAQESNRERKARLFLKASQEIHSAIRDSCPDTTIREKADIQQVLRSWKVAWAVTIMTIPYNWPH